MSDRKCTCHAYMAGECMCGAWDDERRLRDEVTTLKARVKELEGERDAAVREADRWRHGVQIEGDYVCPSDLERDTLRAQLDKVRADRDTMIAVHDEVEAERDALRDEVERMRLVITQFVNTVSDARRAEERRGQGGQQMSFHGDFCSVNPSTMSRLVWWARELEKAAFWPVTDDKEPR